MQLKYVREHFPRVEQDISRAIQLCRDERGAPESVRASLRELGRQASEAHHLVKASQDEEAIRDCVNAMEASIDRAKRACADGVSNALQKAVMEAHDGLSDLKKRAN